MQLKANTAPSILFQDCLLILLVEQVNNSMEVSKVSKVCIEKLAGNLVVNAQKKIIWAHTLVDELLSVLDANKIISSARLLQS
ncbi:hypothetical protein [Polynucleobacter antarcticus]|nr:hypothetical protein [Polynucleobacter antarcticus]